MEYTKDDLDKILSKQPSSNTVRIECPEHPDDIIEVIYKGGGTITLTCACCRKLLIIGEVS